MCVERHRISNREREKKKIMAEGGGTTLEYTPTWVVALVCTVIVVISLSVERILHFTGKAWHLPPS